PKADVVLNHPSVGLRHAYLQLVEGRLFAVDLESRAGLRWGEVPRVSGWVDRRRPLRIGAVEVRLVGGDAGGDGVGEDHGPMPAPTTSRFKGRRPTPDVFLELRRPGHRTRRCRMDRALVLVGRSERCHVRLPGASRFVCALVRTPEGVWAVDLL